MDHPDRKELGNIGFKRHIRTDELKRYVQNIPFERPEHILSSIQSFSSTVSHILGHKPSLNKVKQVKILPSIFFYHDGMKLKINYKK